MKGRGIVLLVVAVLLAGCSVTRRVPQGEYLLTRVHIAEDPAVPKPERVTQEEVKKYVRQSPNKRLLGVPFYLWVYNAANPAKDNNWNNFKRRVGEQPVLLDTSLVVRSAGNIKTYLHNKGYYNAHADYAIDSARRRARVTYSVTQGEPYRIGRVTYDFRDRFVGAMILQDSISTLLHRGEVFDIGLLDRERFRIAEDLKARGYYDFSVNNISYLADSLAGGRRIDLTVVVKQHVASYNERGEAQLENNSIYRLRTITVCPDYNPSADAPPQTDTVHYHGLDIVCNDRPGVRPYILAQAIGLQPNYLYNAEEIKRAYLNILRLGYFRSANILFTEVPDPERNIVTFVGETPDGKPVSTTESYLDCVIMCTPALRQSYKIEMEGSATSNFYGVSATVGYQNRNLLRGVEVFDISARGGYDFMRIKGKRASYELGGTASLSFPRFITPFPYFDRFNSLRNSPRTKVELSLSSQHRPYYRRTLSGVNYGFAWGRGRFSSFTLKPIDLSLVKMGYIDSAFYWSLDNPYLRNSYQSQLIAGISGSYTFNNQLRNVNGNALVMRFNWETAGNLLSGLTHVFSLPAAGKDYYQLLGIRYAQYVRVDASVSQKRVLGDKSAFAWRLYAGGGLSYGNSSALPFDRLFYAGGSNSMRGWMPRTLGAGSMLKKESNIYPSQLGDFKLEANVEARFPVWGILHGAVFLDAGNIWFLKKEDSAPEGVFRFDTFFKQLGLNTGLGVRFDLNFVVLRLDWGIRLHDPNEPPGSRWIRRFTLSQTAFNIGVGYPF